MNRPQRYRRSVRPSGRRPPRRGGRPVLRLRPILLGIAIVVLVPAATLGWWLLSPLFINKTVDEEAIFPLSSNAHIPAGISQAQVEQSMATWAKIDQEVMEAMPPMTEAANEATMTDAATPPPATPPIAVTAMPKADQGTKAGTSPQPTRLKSGDFRDGDGFHKGNGNATIYRGADGSLLLRLENLRVTNGPGLEVLLTPAADPKSREELTAAGYVDLGKLKGNIGNQNYPIPQNVPLADQGSVVIYCLPFQVVFSVAPLKGTG